MQKTSKILPWIVCLSCGLFFFYEFIQMFMPNSLAPYLMRDFNVTGKSLGLLAASYFDANVLFLLPAGMILDRFSTRKVVLITFTVCIIGTVGFASSYTIGWAAFFRFFTGIGSAFCFLSCMRLASIWFHESRLALVTGLIMTMAFLGGTVAQTPLTILIEHLGWRGAIYCDAALGVLILAIIAIFVKDYPNHEIELKEQRKRQLRELGFWQSLRRSYGNVQNWLGGLCTCFMNLPVYILGGIWGGVFLMQTQAFSSTQAATISSMILIGTLIGSPSVGWFSDKIKRRKLPVVIGAVISLFLILLIIYGPHLSFLAVCGIFLLLGLISSAQIINYPWVAEKICRF